MTAGPRRSGPLVPGPPCKSWPGRRRWLAGAAQLGLGGTAALACGPWAGLGLLLGPGATHAQGTGPVPAFSEEARRRLFGGPQGGGEAAEQARLALLDEAEQQLAAGRGEAALETLERAAMMRHSADAELRIVRAHMALGQYRRALVFASHTAGAHRDQGGGLALYAWLLHLGGQATVAQRLLDDALRAAPGDALLAHTREQISGAWPLAGAPLRQAPWQAAPAAFGSSEADAAAAGARVRGSAVLSNTGRQAVLALPAGDESLATRDKARFWLRNGLGQTVAVAAHRPLGDPGLRLLELREPLPSPQWRVAPREPYAGSPGCMVEYTPDELGRASWPVLRQGFFAGVPGTGSPRPLNLEAPRGPRGGPVFNAQGQWVGVAGRSAAGDLLIGLPQLRELLDAEALPVASAAAASAPPRVGLDSQPELAYEAALLGALQVLVADDRS